MRVQLTGSEQPAEILKIVLDRFSETTARRVDAEIYYINQIPFLKFHTGLRHDWGEFLGHYRLDKMLLAVVPECERAFDKLATQNLVDRRDRKLLVNHLVYVAMDGMLDRLLLLQHQLFQDNFNDSLTASVSALLHALAVARNEEGYTKATNDAIRGLVDATVTLVGKKKREYLTSLFNTMQLIHLPTGIGRPIGSKKPLSVKKREAAEFERHVEDAIRHLLSTKGAMPTKTAVAKHLNIGGLSKGGTATYLSAFRNKLARLGLDYDGIKKRVNK